MVYYTAQEADMSQTADEFGAQVVDCTFDIGERVRAAGMIDRFGALVTIQAIAKHLGEGLRLLLDSNLCSATVVRQVLRRIETAALHETPK
jgi:hypothetical protein